MLSLRNRFGIPGVISVIALVFAMLGGAYAASNDGGGDKATASAKAKKGPRGPKGKTGPAGPTGPVGPAGANGKDGANGVNGEEGEQGPKGDKGDAGASVTNTEFAGAEGTCTEGGSKLVGTATTYACNGKKGDKGEKGDPWTVGGTLPPEETLTGAWGLGKATEGEVESGLDPLGNPLLVPISFSIRLAAGLSESNTHYIKEGEPATTDCPGSAENPQAAAGQLCVYAGDETPFTPVNPEPPEAEGVNFQGIVKPGQLNLTGGGASSSGALLVFGVFSKGAYAYGTWAVTAPPAGP